MMKIFTLLFYVFASAVADEYLDSNVKFSADIYKELVKTVPGNFFVCPFSAQTILSLLSLGASGKTAQELTNALHFPNDAKKIRDIFDALSSSFEIKEPFQLNSANKMYLREGYVIKEDYKRIAVNVFKSDIQNINFTNTLKAANEINAWVQLKTNNKIKELVKERSLSSSTAVVLVNTMYFHGFWLHEFGKPLGQISFHVNERDTVKIDAFEGRNKFNYYENRELNATFLEMPFVGNNVTMTFVLPKNVDGLPQIEANILKVLQKQPYSITDTYVKIPKFKIEKDIDFKTILQSLGVHDAFIPSANFRGISDRDILITDVLQKTFVEVNERGATAASSTKITGMFHNALNARFFADHPFLFFLKHKISGILFVGRYINPKHL